MPIPPHLAQQLPTAVGEPIEEAPTAPKDATAVEATATIFGTVVSGVNLRIKATLSTLSKEFNGASVDVGDKVEILSSVSAEGAQFHQVRVDGKRIKGFVKAEYIQPYLEAIEVAAK